MERTVSAQPRQNDPVLAAAVAVLGASANPERYSNKAVKLLKAKGYAVYPIHPALEELEGLAVYPSLAAVPVPLDTITVYVSPERSSGLWADILQAKPRRVIFNPGAENPALAEALAQAGIQVLNACTLVMLNTGQF
jgi:predicted CoA-binding protein